VLIEDTVEKTSVLRSEARREQNGSPPVTIRNILRAPLRHRPDRIILGEIRSGEAFDLLQLLNAGYSGTLSTIHANSAAQGISGFTTCVLQSGVEIPYLAISSNIAESLIVIMQLERRLIGLDNIARALGFVGKSGNGSMVAQWWANATGHRTACTSRVQYRLRKLKAEYDQAHPEAEINRQIDRLTLRTRTAESLPKGDGE
jgi:Flp pilus assembly CpaF family ATPase